MAKMTVYHGGYEPVSDPEIRIGRNTKDFGAGFYCTIIKEQAERWARRYNSKIVSIYDVRLNSDLKIKDFREMSEEWLDFIYNFISDFMDGVITRKQFWVLAQFKYPTHQINFCSEAALKCLEYRGYEVVE